MGIFGGMSLDVVPALASIKFLQDVPRRALRAAGKEARWFSVPAGWPLFRAGEMSDSIFFVLTGSFGAFKAMRDGRSEFMGHIRSGEPVGEMAMFQGGIDIDGDGSPDNVPHTSSVYALRDSEVLEISRKGFEKLSSAEPEILNAMIRLILSRLREGNQRNRRTAPKVFTLVATSPSIDLELRAIALQKSLSRFGIKARIVTGSEGNEKPSTYFDELEAENDIVILTSTMRDNAWYRLSMRQADRIWVVARADAKPSYPLFPEENSPAQSLKLVDVLLLHHGEERTACRPADWLKAAGAARIFHWQGIEGETCDRLARIIAGRSVGIVFSGGGARAYAHIGVIKALREKGISIDLACGASMGGIIAACAAMGWDDDEIEERIRDAFVESNPLGDHVLPVVALTRGKLVEERLKRHFGDALIEDIELPFFCVSSELTEGAVRIHRRGLLRDALRASISLPGILPPVVANGSLLVDGAVMNNFPTDIMTGMHRGATVGVDVARRGTIEASAFDDPPGFFSWVRKHGLRSAPPIVTLLMRSASARREDAVTVKTADIMITPAVTGVGIRDWKRYDQAVEDGYETAMAALETHLPDFFGDAL